MTEYHRPSNIQIIEGYLVHSLKAEKSKGMTPAFGKGLLAASKLAEGRKREEGVVRLSLIRSPFS
jgi:hypothetical protein